MGVIPANYVLGGINSTSQLEIDVNDVDDSVSDPTSLTSWETDFPKYFFSKFLMLQIFCVFNNYVSYFNFSRVSLVIRRHLFKYGNLLSFRAGTVLKWITFTCRKNQKRFSRVPWVFFLFYPGIFAKSLTIHYFLFKS